MDLVIVDAADTLVALDPPTTIATTDSASVCFAALASGRYLAGLSWTFDVDGSTTVQGDDSIARNCVSVTTLNTTGSVVVQASAGGQQTSLSLAVGAMARTAPHRSTPQGGVNPPRSIPVPWRPTAGERARM